MTESEIEPTRINTNDPANWQLTEHRMICRLFQSEYEQTYLEKLEPNQTFAEKSKHGIELLIIKGQLCCDTVIYQTGSWVRLPINSIAQFQAGPSGATLYVKTDHLQHALDAWGDMNNHASY